MGDDSNHCHLYPQYYALNKPESEYHWYISPSLSTFRVTKTWNNQHTIIILLLLSQLRLTSIDINNYQPGSLLLSTRIFYYLSPSCTDNVTRLMVWPFLAHKTNPYCGYFLKPQNVEQPTRMSIKYKSNYYTLNIKSRIFCACFTILQTAYLIPLLSISNH